MYLLYDCLENSPFSIATKAVLKHLQIPFSLLDSSKAFKPHGGYFGRISSLEQFIFANVYNIALASLEEKKLLAIEEDSYANLTFTLALLRDNKALRDFAVAELQSHNIVLNIDILQNHIAYFPAILADYTERIRDSIQYSFSKTAHSMPAISPYTTNNGFSAVPFYSGRHADCDMQGEYRHIPALCELLGLKYIESEISLQSYTHLTHIDMDKAYQKSGELLYAGIDLGVDFFCVFADSTFNMFDSKQALCSKYSKRDSLNIVNLNLAQILLVSFGKTKEAGFASHTISPSFWHNDNKAS